MLVYVLNKHGKPLMPCKPQKAGKLLKQGKAKVVKKEPFTIQLLYGSSGYMQPITLGVDAGSKVVGLSATTEKQELYTSEVQLRNDIVELLSERRQYRRGRRSRKTRYRKARFLNRRRPEEWLAPSVQHKVDSHIKLVDRLHRLLPISKVIVEVASFDIQKIQNPDISGEQYQQGEQLGFWNVREYVLWRDGHRCQGKKGCENTILNVHHIESRKVGGNSPGNLVTLCEQCHKAYHAGKLKLDLKRGSSFRDAAFMGIMRWAVFNKLKTLYPDVQVTYGYNTKYKRILVGLEKNHRTDARCITGNLRAVPADIWYYCRLIRKNNRSLHKANVLPGGIRKANKAPYIVHGYRLFDKVLYEGKVCFIFGRRSSGYFDLRQLDGTKIHASASTKKLKLVFPANTMLIERRIAG